MKVVHHVGIIENTIEILIIIIILNTRRERSFVIFLDFGSMILNISIATLELYEHIHLLYTQLCQHLLYWQKQQDYKDEVLPPTQLFGFSNCSIGKPRGKTQTDKRELHEVCETNSRSALVD